MQRLTTAHRVDLNCTSQEVTSRNVAANIYTFGDPAEVSDVDNAYHILDVSMGYNMLCPESLRKYGRWSLYIENCEYCSHDLAHLESLLGVWLLGGEIESVDQLPEGFAEGHRLGFVILGATSPEDNGTLADFEQDGTPTLYPTRLAAEAALAGYLASDPGWADQCGFEEIEATPAAIDPDGWVHWANGHASPADYRTDR